MSDFKPCRTIFRYSCNSKYSYKDIIRFNNFIKFDSKNKCWLWLGGSRNKRGKGNYGAFHMRVGYNKYKSAVASRIAYEMFIGRIVSNTILVCHKCDNPICVNPYHLFLGTTSDNAVDKFNKGRGVDNSGENNGMAKINWEIVEKIRIQYRLGYTQKQIANKFGVSASLVGFIINNKTWYDNNYIIPESRSGKNQRNGYNGDKYRDKNQ